MKFKYLVIIVVLLFQASLSYSQESLRLSLMDARAYALEYNKTMKNSNFAIDKACNRIRTLRLLQYFEQYGQCQKSRKALSAGLKIVVGLSLIEISFSFKLLNMLPKLCYP
jgi:hypothetical protein